jgi:hypothetical protein
MTNETFEPVPPAFRAAQKWLDPPADLTFVISGTGLSREQTRFVKRIVRFFWRKKTPFPTNGERIERQESSFLVVACPLKVLEDSRTRPSAAAYILVVL